MWTKINIITELASRHTGVSNWITLPPDHISIFNYIYTCTRHPLLLTPTHTMLFQTDTHNYIHALTYVILHYVSFLLSLCSGRDHKLLFICILSEDTRCIDNSISPQIPHRSACCISIQYQLFTFAQRRSTAVILLMIVCTRTILSILHLPFHSLAS